MQLNLHRNQHHNAITACDHSGITINKTVYRCSLIVAADSLHTPWPVVELQQLTLELLQPVLAARPDILLIGTGARQQLPDLALQQALLQHGIVAEFMHTRAACRTFNILLDEQRRVMAALIWPAGNPSDPAAHHCA